MPLLAVIDRDVFIPYLFTRWTTVKPAARNAGLESQGVPLGPADLVKILSPEWQQRYALSESYYALHWPQTFDYVVCIDFGQRRELLPEQLQLVTSGSFFQIYKIVR